MNILPKKSWHVRTRKNIERVKRDEAEAERLARIEQDKTLRIEQEVRIRELRLRSGIPSPKASGHFNLFEAPEDNRQSTNKEHDDEQRQEEAKSEQRAGIFNRLGRSGDANKPWYCLPKPDHNERAGSSPITSSDKKRLKSNLITSIYDPMTTMRHAEEVIRARRAERREQERLTNSSNQQSIAPTNYFDGLQFQGPSQQPSRLLPTEHEIESNAKKNDIEELDFESSPEIVKIIEKDNNPVKPDKRRKHSKKKSKRHKRNSPERKHTKHHHKRRQK